MKLYYVNIFCAIFSGIFGFYLLFSGNVFSACINLFACLANVISIHIQTRTKTP